MIPEDLAALVAQTAREELPHLIGHLEAAKAEAWVRLSSAATDNGREAQAPDENLSAEEAARRLGVSKVYLYRNVKRLPFALRIGRRVVFSARGLERWNRQQRS